MGNFTNLLAAGLLANALAALSAQAQAPAKDFNNGCGSGWNEKLVPDGVSLLCIDYRQACANHDNCYSRCLPGGETYGQQVCQQTADELRSGRRMSCDNKFLTDIDTACAPCDPVRKQVCKGMGRFYRIMVRLGGGGSFQGFVIPKDFLTFLETEEGQRFDLDAFEKELLEVAKIPGMDRENRFQLTMREGRPQAKFVSTAPRAPVLWTQLPSQRIYMRESIEYGFVDLSEATIAGKPFRTEAILKLPKEQMMDLGKLKSIKEFKMPGPAK